MYLVYTAKGRILHEFGAVAMSPLENAMSVLPRLPSRPHVVEKRDGPGRRYHELRYWSSGDGSSKGRKHGIYLGRLNPLQKLAVRQAIGEAWAPERNPSANRHLRQIAARKKQHRKARDIVSALARRAGYRLCGYRLQKVKMNARTHNEQIAMPPDGAKVASEVMAILMKDTQSTDDLRKGLTLLQEFNQQIMEQETVALMRRIIKRGGMSKAADLRAVKALLRLAKHDVMIRHSLARLERHGEER